MSTQISVRDEHVQILSKVAGIVYSSKTKEEIENIVRSELSFLDQRIALSKLGECTQDSLMFCVKQAMRDNLTLNPSAGLVYMIPQPVNVGTKEQPKWINVAQYLLAPDGRLSLARQTGNILDHKRVKINHDANGKVIGGTFEILKPSVPQPRWEEYEFNEWDIERWAAASAKKNKGVSNPLYSSWKGGIDPEFFRAKVVKHSLSKLGININESRGVVISQPVVEIPIQAQQEQIQEAIIQEEIPTPAQPQSTENSNLFNDL